MGEAFEPYERAARNAMACLPVGAFGDGLAEHMLQCTGQSFSRSAPVPVTAKLSKLFYDRLGEPIANELVDWFNNVDSDYRGQLRDLNEMNFARFDAKLEQRVGESTAKMEQRFTESTVKLEAKLDRRTAELEVKLDRRTAELEAKIDRVAAELNAKIDSVAAELKAKIDRFAAELRETLERRLGEQMRWFFVMWATQMVAIIGLWARK